MNAKKLLALVLAVVMVLSVFAGCNETKPVDTKPINPGNNSGAAQTGDPMIIAAVVSAISACGVMIAKKRK